MGSTSDAQMLFAEKQFIGIQDGAGRIARADFNDLLRTEMTDHQVENDRIAVRIIRILVKIPQSLGFIFTEEDVRIIYM